MNIFTETIISPNLSIGIDVYCSAQDANNEYVPLWQKRISIAPYIQCSPDMADMAAELVSFIQEKANSYLRKDAKFIESNKRRKATGLPCVNIILFIDVNSHDVNQVKSLLENKLVYIFNKYIG